MTSDSSTPDPEQQVREIHRRLASMASPLTQQVRLEMGLVRIVSYLRAAEKQPRRIADARFAGENGWSMTNILGPNQEQALCEAHFYFICWDSIYKAGENLRNNSYRFVSFRESLKGFEQQLKYYQKARHHLEHFTERWPGQPRTDWEGEDSNSITGTVAGVTRDLIFVFQNDRWDVSTRSLEPLRDFVYSLVTCLRAEVEDKYARFLEGN